MKLSDYKTKFKINLVSIITLILLGNLVAQAQDPAQLKEIFARSQQQNAQALRQYAWKSRNEVKKNGESKSTKVFEMRYDANGNLQKRQISATEPSLPKGPLIGRIAQKKKDDFIEMVNKLGEQVKAYSQLPPEKMQAFLASATITPKLNEGMVQIQGEHLLQRGDVMRIFIDVKSRKQRRVEIATFFENQPVKAVIEFSELPAGLTYTARTVVDYPKESLQLITENFGYQREGR
ncbi:MAG: hypothetical protein AB1757_24500 [Acidobacteriota bacterium]